MKRIGIGTLLSIALNLFMFFWLVEQYLNDLYFQAFVNATFGPIYPFIVLTLGVGGGSGLGYFLLKRRHGPASLGIKSLKPRTFRPLTTVASPSSSSSATIIAKNAMPSGTPPSIASKHTAYSVPSLSKISSPTPSRSIPSGGSSGSSWSTAAKPSTPSTTARGDTITRSPQIQSSRIDEPKAGLNAMSSTPRPEVTPFSGSRGPPSETSSRPSSFQNWRPDQPNLIERRSDVLPPFQKAGVDAGFRPGTQNTGTVPTSAGQQPPPIPPGQKWQPPEQKPAPSQWTNATAPPKPDAPAPVPSKWSSLQGTMGSQTPPQTQSPPGIPPRTGPLPPRPPYPQSQGPPRPFVYQGPRPGEQRPMGVPRPFGPDPNRPPMGMTGGPRPPPQRPVPRPSTSSGIGPMPQPWSPQGQTSEKTPSNAQASPSTASEQSMKSPLEQNIPETEKQSSDPPGNEMDWDTALDTILKTLRKDRVGEKA